MRATLALALLLGCPGRAPTLDVDAERPEANTESCCCLVEYEEPVAQEHLVEVCVRVGGECVEAARCEAFAVQPCCCITVRGEETRYAHTTWGECVEPGTCHPGECTRYGGPAPEPITEGPEENVE